MAIIRFTEADVLQTKVIEAGYYPSIVTDITGPTKSSSGKSTNYFFEIQVSDGKYKGKTVRLALTDGSDSASLLGSMQWMPQARMLEINAAINNLKDITPLDLDTDSLKMKPFDAKWEVGTNEGNLFNYVSGFYPSGYGSQQPAF